MQIEFTKMQALGNDFIVIDSFNTPVKLDAEQIRQLADRHFGVGFDQLLLLGPPENGGDVSYRIFNADGGEVSQCGNGARCVAVYLHDRGLVKKDEIVAETRDGLLTLYREADGQIRVNMGVPRFEPADIPIRARQRENHYVLDLDGESVTFSALSMGNPHAVLKVEDAARAPVGELGPRLQAESFFPEGVNVGFMQVLDNSRIRLRVFERGAGETLACGSGACAAVVAGSIDGLLAEEVDVSLNGGHLLVSWAGEGNPAWITGPAAFVFEGQINI